MFHCYSVTGLFLTTLFIGNFSWAQNDQQFFNSTWGAIQTFEVEKEAIKKQTGCFEVKFQFAETFPLVSDYQRKEPYETGAIEWVTVDQEENDRILLQHVLTTPHGSIKHWSQEWIYQPTETRFNFKGHFTWEKEKLPAHRTQGQWTQRVYNVDDSPRYECLAAWVLPINGSLPYWECKSWNPLPRREYTTRSDYDVLDRRNRHQLTENGWLHEQDSEKLVVRNGTITALVKEKGENSYRRTDSAQCAQAEKFWTERRDAWTLIHEVWEEVSGARNTLKLTQNFRGAPLFVALTNLAEELTNQPPADRAAAKVVAKQLIEKYLE